MVPQSWNRYSYVANDPANRIDPRGLDPYEDADEPALDGGDDDSGGGGGDACDADFCATGCGEPEDDGLDGEGSGGGINPSPVGAGIPTLPAFNRDLNALARAAAALDSRTAFALDCDQEFAALGGSDFTPLPSALADVAANISFSNGPAIQQSIATATSSPLGNAYQAPLDSTYASYLQAHQLSHLTVSGYFTADRGLQAWTPYEGNTIFINPNTLDLSKLVQMKFL